MSSKSQKHRPEDDPEPGTPGTGEDICPDCHGTGKQVDKFGKQTDEPCERCDGTGIITEGIG
jgi:DnaJ-class molecular chaperone